MTAECHVSCFNKQEEKKREGYVEDDLLFKGFTKKRNTIWIIVSQVSYICQFIILIMYMYYGS